MPAVPRSMINGGGFRTVPRWKPTQPRPVPRPVPRQVKPTVTPFGPGRRQPVKLQPARTMIPPQSVRETFITHYDPSRVISPEQIRVVKDLREGRVKDERQTGAERGEIQAGDNGALGPGSDAGAFARGEAAKPTVAPVATKQELTPGQLALLALGTFLLFGG